MSRTRGRSRGRSTTDGRLAAPIRFVSQITTMDEQHAEMRNKKRRLGIIRIFFARTTGGGRGG
ncbi:hypothetical protein RSAG8_07732, partial [Rhizoctonia solani AG-8 WAC10335]